jgi:HTH-type transcriptional regulator / antitoxin HigA
MNLRPIVTDEDHREALEEIERLWNPAPGSPEEAKFDALVTLVEAYERKQWPVERLDPIESIKAHMQWNDYSQRDLAELLGSRSRASEILNRRRPLTLAMIHRLHEAWGMSVESLVQPYELDAA